MKNIITLLTVITLLSSCDKLISGSITDNFGEPVNNVKISIENSGYKSISDEQGNFEIDYSAGKISLDFKKENYISIHKELDISEKKSHPMGSLKMMKIPDSTGLFFKGESDFQAIPMTQMKFTEKKSQNPFSGQNRSEINYYLMNDDIFIIKVDSLTAIEIYDRSSYSLTLVKPDGNSVAVSISRGFENSVISKNVLNIKTKLGSTCYHRTFIPELNTTYAYIITTNTNGVFGTSTTISKNVYAFKFMK